MLLEKKIIETLGDYLVESLKEHGAHAAMTAERLFTSLDNCIRLRRDEQIGWCLPWIESNLMSDVVGNELRRTITTSQEYQDRRIFLLQVEFALLKLSMAAREFQLFRPN